MNSDPAGGGEPSAGLMSLHIVGTGLIGTSIGLAARAAGLSVTLADRDERRLARAVERGAGRAGEPRATAALAVAAVPPSRVADVVKDLMSREVAATVTHVSSVQVKPLLEVEASMGRNGRVVGGHPIAGREQSGPDAASADLFRDRAWVLCPTPYTAPEATASVETLAQLCGGRAVRMTAADHDQLLARLSHVPQLVASALAAAVAGLPGESVALAGSGLRDTTRLAESDERLWTEIIGANPLAVSVALRAVADPLAALADVLADADPDAVARAVAELLRRGQAGRAKLPGKHGQQPTPWATVSVVVPDRPGALAALLAAVAATGVNLEDLRVEHAPGQPEGIAELAVGLTSQDTLAAALRADGWSVTLGADAAR